MDKVRKRSFKNSWCERMSSLTSSCAAGSLISAPSFEYPKSASYVFARMSGVSRCQYLKTSAVRSLTCALYATKVRVGIASRLRLACVSWKYVLLL